MVHFCSASVRAVLHSLKDLVEALLDPLKHAQVNSLTGVVSFTPVLATFSSQCDYHLDYCIIDLLQGLFFHFYCERRVD